MCVVQPDPEAPPVSEPGLTIPCTLPQTFLASESLLISHFHLHGLLPLPLLFLTLLLTTRGEVSEHINADAYEGPEVDRVSDGEGAS